MASRCGIDIVEIERFEKLLQRSSVPQLGDVFTTAEWNYCQSKRHPTPSLAARFALKEACMKLFPAETNRAELNLIDIEIVMDNDGAPHIHLGAKLTEFLQRHGLSRISVSISHTPTYACGIAIAE